MTTTSSGRIRRRDGRLDRLSRRDRSLLWRALFRKAFKEWWHVPDARFHLPPRDPVRMMEYVRNLGIRDGDSAGRAISFFLRLAFPLLGDSRALSVECAADGARGWVESFYDDRRSGAFQHADSVMRWMQWVTEDLLGEPLAVRRVRWQRDGSFKASRLLPRGVVSLAGGGYRVYPPEAHPWFQDGHDPEPFTLKDEEVIIFKRPAALGAAIPLFRAVPHIFDAWLENHKVVGTLGARTFAEDRRIRTQVARLRPFALPDKRLSQSRAARAFGASLLELNHFSEGVTGMLGLDGHSEYAPVTEHYLAWQHREALRIAGAVRVELLEFLGRNLFRRSARRAGFEAPGLRLDPRDAPTLSEIDQAFEDYATGHTDIFGYHERTMWA